MTLHNTVAYYIALVYMTNYMSSIGKLPQSTALWIGTSCLAVFVLLLPLMGWLSDRIGRRPLLITSCIGYAVLDPDGSVHRVFAGFPTDLFLTLVGVTLLFTQAHGNGTLDAVARAAVRLSGGSAGLIPIVFFALTFALASSGAGNIAASALVSPMAMAVARNR